MKIGILALVLVSSAALVACSDETDSTTETTTTTATTATGGAGGGTGGAATGGAGGGTGGAGGATVCADALPDENACLDCCDTTEVESGTKYDEMLFDECAANSGSPCYDDCDGSDEAACWACLDGLDVSEQCIVDFSAACEADAVCPLILDCQDSCFP